MQSLFLPTVYTNVSQQVIYIINWMDDLLFYVLFYNILDISEQRMGDNERR